MRGELLILLGILLVSWGIYKTIQTIQKQHKEEEEDREHLAVLIQKQQPGALLPKQQDLTPQKETKKPLPKGIEKYHKTIEKTTFYFDKEGIEIYEKWWEEDEDLTITINDEGYLIAKTKKGNEQRFDRFIQEENITEKAEELNCEEEDIHIHHKNGYKNDNRTKNLEVLHKEEHAEKHGFTNWKEYKQFLEAEKKKR